MNCRLHHVVSVAFVSAAICAASNVAFARADCPEYTIVDIGALGDLTNLVPTPPSSSALAINDAGVVGGSSSVSGGSLQLDEFTWIAEPWTDHAVTWSPDALNDLGVLGGDVPPNQFPRPSSWVNSINALGQLAGDGDVVADGWYHPFIHLPQPAYGLPAGFTELPILAIQAHAWAINDNGIIAGETRETPASSFPVAIFWRPENGAMTINNLGTLGGLGSIAYGVNNHDEITGTFTTGAPENATHAFLYLPQPAYGMPAGANVISTGFPNSIGRDVNDLGQVAGRGPGWSPMIWLPEPAYGLPAGLTYFPVETMFDDHVLAAHGFLGPELAEFYAINDHGVAVGDVQFAVMLPNGTVVHTTRGFVWRGGVFSLLEDLQTAGWATIAIARDVNDAGQIVGIGENPTGDSRGFVMTPTQRAGDLTGPLGTPDGTVDALDFLLLIAQWGTPCAGSCEADITGPVPLEPDGNVDALDFLLLIGQWGTPGRCGP